MNSNRQAAPEKRPRGALPIPTAVQQHMACCAPPGGQARSAVQGTSEVDGSVRGTGRAPKGYVTLLHNVRDGGWESSANSQKQHTCTFLHSDAWIVPCIIFYQVVRHPLLYFTHPPSQLWCLLLLLCRCDSVTGCHHHRRHPCTPSALQRVSSHVVASAALAAVGVSSGGHPNPGQH
jgi:hypothetical protein